MAPEPRAPAEWEIVSTARYLVEAHKRYGGSSVTVRQIIGRLETAVEQLDAERREPPPVRRLAWDVPRVLGTLGVVTGSVLLWALAGAGLAYLVGLVGSWL